MQSAQFVPGTNPTPDTVDQFLANIGFCRKLPTDSTCLFNVISEQELGDQSNHWKYRHICVEYMRQNADLFAMNINCNFQSYLENMASPYTYGTTLELKALAMCFNANVVLFEPFDSGRWFVATETPTSTWRLFWDRNNHFNSVFTLDHMGNQAQVLQQLHYQQQEPRLKYIFDQMRNQQQKCMQYELLLLDQQCQHLQAQFQHSMQYVMDQQHSNFQSQMPIFARHFASAHHHLNQQVMGYESVAGVAGHPAQRSCQHGLSRCFFCSNIHE